jgi:hypothetical protein
MSREEKCCLTLLIAIMILLGFGMWKVPASPNCFTMSEARKAWPDDHLYTRRGCWISKAHKKPVRPIIEPTPLEIGESKKRADANGNDLGEGRQQLAQAEPEPPPPLDLFLTPKEPMREYMVPEYAQKGDRLAAPQIGPQEKILPPPDPPAPPPKPVKVSFGLWASLIAVGFGLAVGFAMIFNYLLDQLEKRKSYVYNRKPRNAVARPDYNIEASRERPIAGSDGPRVEQPHIHSWEFPRWWGRTDERGHALHNDPVATRGDDFSAIGAWAKSRGLRPEAEGGSDQAADIGGPRKRFAFFSRG